MILFCVVFTYSSTYTVIVQVETKLAFPAYSNIDIIFLSKYKIDISIFNLVHILLRISSSYET